MLLEIAVAAVIGISFANVWTCMFMGFGTSAQHRITGQWFIAGRFLGLAALGSVISLFRFAAQDAAPVLLLIFGVTTLSFGIFMMVTHISRTVFSREHIIPLPNPREHIISVLASYFLVVPGGGKGRCKGKKEHGSKGQHPCKKYRVQEKKYGFVLGVLRGATPCAKVIVLSPLLVAVGFPYALLLVFVYAASSTVYPLIGYLSADLLSKFEGYRVHLKITGAVILVIIGVYSVANVLMWNTNHLWS